MFIFFCFLPLFLIKKLFCSWFSFSYIWFKQSGQIASGIDAEALKCSSASIPDAIWPDCWTHYNSFEISNSVFFNNNNIKLSNNIININYVYKPFNNLYVINQKDNKAFYPEFIDKSYLPIIFNNSIKHILFAKPFFMAKKNIPLRKLELEYFKDDLDKYGIDGYKLLEDCLFWR